MNRERRTPNAERRTVWRAGRDFDVRCSMFDIRRSLFFANGSWPQLTSNFWKCSLSMNRHSNRVSPRHLAALEVDTKQNTPIYSLRSVFHARFLAIANHRLLQHPPVVSARHHFGLMPEPDQRFDYLNQTAGAAPPWPGTCHGRGRTSAGRPGYDIGESGGVSPHPLSSGCLCHARNASYIRFALQPKCRAKNRQQDRETRSNPTDLLSTKPLPLATVDSIGCSMFDVRCSAFAFFR